MQNPLTEQEIIARLHRSHQTASSDGYAEIPISAETQLKSAAVLVPLFLQANQWHLLYTRRTDSVESHRGQVSFPGGACDPNDETFEQTALREAQEEIGLLPEDVQLVGQLRTLITITNFRITPVVSIIPWPYTFRISTEEVGRVFSMPLSWLSDPINRWEFTIPGRGNSVIYFQPYDGELLWGATARMTVDLLNVFE